MRTTMNIKRTPLLAVRTYAIAGMRTVSVFWRGTCVLKLGWRNKPTKRMLAARAERAELLAYAWLQADAIATGYEPHTVQIDVTRGTREFIAQLEVAKEHGRMRDARRTETETAEYADAFRGDC